MPHPVASYFTELHASLGAGTPETSGYNALGNLLNAVGAERKPKIGAVLQLKDTGGKHPDGGLFSLKELQRRGVSSPSLLDFKPERGVIEIKGLACDLEKLAETPQVRGYLEHYGQILLTNYRAFALFFWENGQAVAGECFSIADSETEFWHIARAGKNDPILHERLWKKPRPSIFGLPVLRTLFVQFADPAKVRALNLEEVLDWAEACLARVDRSSFFARYDMGGAVQYFYEPFLAEFDPELRRSFGV